VFVTLHKDAFLLVTMSENNSASCLLLVIGLFSSVLCPFLLIILVSSNAKSVLNIT
jgi:hypothetical protein